MNILKQDKFLLWQKFVEKQQISSDIEAYNKSNNKLNPLLIILIQTKGHKTYTNDLIKTIQSIQNQPYQNWKIVVTETINLSLKGVESKIKYVKNDELIKYLAKLDFSYVCSISPGDVVSKNLLIACFDEQKAKSPDIIYFDYDFINNRQRYSPVFKPDWSFFTFLSFNYIENAFFSKLLFINYFNLVDGDYNYLELFYSNQTARVSHISKILLHKKSKLVNKKNINPIETQIFPKINFNKGLTDDSNKYNFKITQNELISIIIPTKNQYSAIKKCLESIIKKTTYKNYEIIIVDHESTDTTVLKLLSDFSKSHKFKLTRVDGKFNFSKLINIGVSHSKGAQLLFLNNDVEVITPNWLEELLGLSQQQNIGAVGCLLLYPNKKIQHCGVVLGLNDCAGHPYKGYSTESNFNMYEPLIIREVSAVTAACLMVKRSIYNEVDGLDERLEVAYNDVDFCLKISKAGYKNIYTPFAKLFHYESLSRGDDVIDPLKKNRVDKEIGFMHNKWKDLLMNDPYYNRNLTKKFEDYSVEIIDI